jgi:signal transduction histidine kinase
MDIRFPLVFCIVTILVLTAGCVSSSPSVSIPTTTLSETTAALSVSAPDEELVDFVNNAVIYAHRVGTDAALKEFNDPNGSFTHGDRYIWAHAFNGTSLAHPYHPEYVGTYRDDGIDASGFKMNEAMRNVALNGSGFVHYQFENPVTGKIESKLSYAKQVDDTWWLASGVYESNVTIVSQAP